MTWRATSVSPYQVAGLDVLRRPHRRTKHRMREELYTCTCCHSCLRYETRAVLMARSTRAEGAALYAHTARCTRAAG